MSKAQESNPHRCDREVAQKPRCVEVPAKQTVPHLRLFAAVADKPLSLGSFCVDKAEDISRSTTPGEAAPGPPVSRPVFSPLFSPQCIASMLPSRTTETTRRSSSTSPSSDPVVCGAEPKKVAPCDCKKREIDGRRAHPVNVTHYCKIIGFDDARFWVGGKGGSIWLCIPHCTLHPSSGEDLKTVATASTHPAIARATSSIQSSGDSRESAYCSHVKSLRGLSLFL